jgi:hypothetical protein
MACLAQWPARFAAICKAVHSTHQEQGGDCLRFILRGIVIILVARQFQPAYLSQPQPRIRPATLRHSRLPLPDLLCQHPLILFSARIQPRFEPDKILPVPRRHGGNGARGPSDGFGCRKQASRRGCGQTHGHCGKSGKHAFHTNGFTHSCIARNIRDLSWPRNIGREAFSPSWQALERFSIRLHRIGRSRFLFYRDFRVSR